MRYYLHMPFMMPFPFTLAKLVAAWLKSDCELISEVVSEFECVPADMRPPMEYRFVVLNDCVRLNTELFMLALASPLTPTPLPSRPIVVKGRRRFGGGDGGGNGWVDTSALPFRPQYSSRTTNTCGYLTRKALNSFCGPTNLRTSEDDWDAWPATLTIGSQSSSRLLICLRKKAIASCSISFMVRESYWTSVPGGVDEVDEEEEDELMRSVEETVVSELESDELAELEWFKEFLLVIKLIFEKKS